MDESLSNVLRLRTLFLVTFLALFEVTSLIIASASAPLRTDSQADVLIAGGAAVSVDMYDPSSNSFASNPPKN